MAGKSLKTNRGKAKVEIKPAPSPKIVETHRCIRCGVEKRVDEYFKSSWSKVWVINAGKVLICKDCLTDLMTEMSQRYNEEIAVKICCCYLDIPYNNSVYRSLIEKNNTFHLGMYVRTMQLQQHKNQSFFNCFLDGELTKGSAEIKEELESKWSRADKQNMNFVLSVVGYDPFEAQFMSDNDRRFCFNVLANYCNADGIQEDGHKIQSVIQITQSQLQCTKLDELINSEMLSSSASESRMKQLTQTKKYLQDTIAKIARDNNVSSNYNDSSKKGAHTLSSKMKELSDNGFKAIEVNLFDIKTSEAMKQIADLSNRSILDQLGLDSNDYVEMITEQREMILKLENENDALKEENRILKNQIELLKKKKK